MALPPYAGKSIWVWYLGAQEQGNLDAMAQAMQQAGLRSVLIKAGDGSNIWSQFTKEVVQAFHAHGLLVGAWNFIYLDDVAGEIAAAVHALDQGADFFVIDAEGNCEGKPQQALQYGEGIRAQYPNAPLLYAPFCWPSYHPRYPYAQFNHFCQGIMPQTYWADIGVDVGYCLTRMYNEMASMGRDIIPIGQLYGTAKPSDITAFAGIVAAHQGLGVSFWNWQDANAANWHAMAYAGMIQQGATGVAVQELQTLLNQCGASLAVDGDFGPLTREAVVQFQAAHQLAQDGIVGPLTWGMLYSVADQIRRRQGETTPVTPPTPQGSTPLVAPVSGALASKVANYQQRIHSLLQQINQLARVEAQNADAIAQLTQQVQQLQHELATLI